MRLPRMPKENGGFTLVELLIVMLIIVILSVAALPLLRPFVVQAKYSANAVPVIGNLRTKIEVYRNEKDRLPGVYVDATTEKTPVTVTIGSMTVGDSSLCLSGGTLIQGMAANNAVGLADATYAADGTVNYLTNGLAYSGVNVLPQHVFNATQTTYDDLKGTSLRPQHVQYIAPIASGAGDARLFGVGVFGDDTGLPKGTGYAVLEFNDPAHQRKFIATWKRWKPLNSDPKQIRFTYCGGSTTIDNNTMTDDGTVPIVNTSDTANMCPIPMPLHLFGTDTQYAQAVAAMKLWGWEL